MAEELDWKKILKDTKKLEKEAPPIKSDADLLKMRKESFEEAKKLATMLSPQWFVKDTDVEKKKVKKK